MPKYVNNYLFCDNYFILTGNSVTLFVTVMITLHFFSNDNKFNSLF